MSTYQIGDLVLYGLDGVCKIESITQQSVHGVVNEYYVLKPVNGNNATVYVPLKNDALVNKMRRILSREEIYELIHAMHAVETVWIEDDTERKEQYRQILASGDRTEMVRMIKTLYIHQQEQRKKGRKLHLADERFFKEAERALYEEFALVLDIRPEQVLPFIAEEINIEE